MTDVISSVISGLVDDFIPLLGTTAVEMGLRRKPFPPDLGSTEKFVAYHFLSNFLKKYGSDGRPSPAQESASMETFRLFNTRCGQWVEPRMNDIEAMCIGEFTNELHRLADGIEVFDFYDLWLSGNVGPGASRATHGTDLISKVFGPSISATSSDLHFAWDHCVQRNASWTSASYCGRRQTFTRKVVEGSKVTFVSKNVDTARMVMTEATVNMWFQLGLGSKIERYLMKRFSISLDTQPSINRALAQRGSLTGRLATIDLRSASDCIAWPMLQRYAPTSLTSWLGVLRSRTTAYRSESIQLNMVSTMGNGFTFPLQTAIFACLVSAVAKVRDIVIHWSGPLRNVGVFGDDIICPTEMYGMLSHTLELLGFVVNTDKSYSMGPFRESCGGNYFRGKPSPPVFLKGRSDWARCSAINGVVRWSAVTGIRVPSLVRALDTSLPRVPAYMADDAGIHVPRTWALGPCSARAELKVRHFKTPCPVVRLYDNGTTMRISVPRQYRAFVSEGAAYLAFIRGAIRSITPAKGGMPTRWIMALRPPETNTRHVAWERVHYDHWDLNPGFLLERITWGQWYASIRANLT